METRAAADPETIVTEVRKRYGRIATKGSSCCGSGGCGTQDAVPVALGLGYRKEEVEAAEEANLGLGCGAPIGFLGLRAGETVLDLGSGPGFDAFLAAREVGRRGRVIGVDMTPEMLERARVSADRLGLPQVEFREGRLEALPVEDASVDAVTSNCVINLVPDKARVFREVARVLKPGGRLVISDIVLDGPLPEAVETDVYAYVGCVSGAAPREDYFARVREAGLEDVEVLRDTDSLEGLREVDPVEAQGLLDRTGVSWNDVAGRVRSITFRARRRG
jgi:arsenite methyltransferase